MIDYSLIDRSIKFYESDGFKRIESPWTVTKQISDITKPADSKTFELKHDDNKVLVASAEQSFLYLYLKGFLPLGQYQSCGPCFRHDSFDNWHTKYFIKNELIKTDSTSTKDLDQILKIALSCFNSLGFDNLEIIETKLKSSDKIFNEYSFDILSNKIELGSYGIRQCSFLKWCYGTILAEPRGSMILNYKNFKKQGVTI